MTLSQKRQVERLRRVAGFGSRHQAEFTATSIAPTLFAQLIDCLNSIEAIRNPSGSLDGGRMVPERKKLLQLLREDLERIARTARLIQTENSAVAGQFQLPDKRRPGDLVAAGHSFVQRAAPLQEEFRSYELPETFFLALQDQLAAIEALQPGAALAPGGKSAAVAEILSRGHRALETLDVVIHNKYRGEGTVLAEWATAKDVRSTAGRKQKERG